MFTPLEFGTVGLSEEKAIDSYGESNIEVSLVYFARSSSSSSFYKEKGERKGVDLVKT